MTSAAFGEIRAITLDMYGTLLDLEPSPERRRGRHHAADLRDAR